MYIYIYSLYVLRFIDPPETFDVVASVDSLSSMLIERLKMNNRSGHRLSQKSPQYSYSNVRSNPQNPGKCSGACGLYGDALILKKVCVYIYISRRWGYTHITTPCYTRIFIINTSYPEDSPRSTKSPKGPPSCSKPVVPPPNQSSEASNIQGLFACADLVRHHTWNDSGTKKN